MGNDIRRCLNVAVWPWWAESPAGTRLLIVGYPFAGLLLTVVGTAAGFPLGPLVFRCSWAFLLHFGSIWSIFVSGFGQLGTNGEAFPMLLMELYMGMIYLPSRERDLGTLGLKVWLMLTNAAINSLFLLFTLLTTLCWNAGYQVVGNSGLLPILILRMSQECLSDHAGYVNFFGLAAVSKKWFPLFIVGGFSVFNPTLLLGQLAGLCLAYLAFFKPELSWERLLPSTSTLAEWEKSLTRCLPNAVLGGTWLSPRGVQAPSASTISRDSDGESGPGFYDRFRPQARPSSFTAFSGRGHKLVGSIDLAPTPLGDAANSSLPETSARGSPPSASSEGEDEWQLV